VPTLWDHSPKAGYALLARFAQEGGGGESAGVTDGPEVAASDDDGDSDDGDPDRRSSLKKPFPSGKHRNATATAGALRSP
jgi:hypothetical protein